MYTATKILLTYLATMTSPTGSPDLCEVVNRLTGTPVVCNPHQEGAPLYDGDVCCAGSTCLAAGTAPCMAGESRYYCELGEADPGGGVSCYFEVADYCDLFDCEEWTPEIGSGPQEDFLCCPWGICTPYVMGSGDCELQDIYFCASVYSNPDGTVGCADWDE